MAARKKSAPTDGAGTARELHLSNTPPVDFEPGGAPSIARPTNLRASALALAARGWAVFPLGEASKVPTACSHGFKDAQTDPGRIKAWWPDGGKANIGAVPPAGVFVVDVDVYKSRDKLQPLVDRMRSLGGPMQRTGGGGWHFALRGKAPRQADLRRAWGVKDGIEIKAHKKGYIVASPSVHPETAVIYEWEVSLEAAIPAAPDWLLKGPVMPKDDGPSAVQPAEDLSWAYRANVPASTVREALTKLPADCARDTWVDYGQAIQLEYGEAGFPLWHEWSATATGTDKKGAPMYPGKAECQRVWASFGQNVGVGADVVTVRSILRGAGMTVGEATTPAGSGRFILTKASDRMKRNQEHTYRTALGAACPIGVVMLAGIGGSGKSTIAATWAAHVTTGVPCVPWEAKTTAREPAAVLWLTTEENCDAIVLPRHQAIGGNCDLLFIPEIATVSGDDGRPRAEVFDIEMDLRGLLEQAAAAGTPIRLVVCDALPALVQWDGRSPTSDVDVKKLLRGLAALAEAFGACILGVAHLNKKADQADEHRISGAQSWRESPRLSFMCRKGAPAVVYTNKSNDLPDVGTTFTQEVIRTLFEIPAETEDGEPMRVTARRAAFADKLMPKDKVLERVKLAEAAVPSVPAGTQPRERRIDKLTAIADEVLGLVGDDIEKGALWRAVKDEHSAPTYEERAEIVRRLHLTERRAGRKHYLRRA